MRGMRFLCTQDRLECSQTLSANAHRVRKRQPEDGLIGFGGLSASGEPSSRGGDLAPGPRKERPAAIGQDAQKYAKLLKISVPRPIRKSGVIHDL